MNYLYYKYACEHRSINTGQDSWRLLFPYSSTVLYCMSFKMVDKSMMGIRCTAASKQTVDSSMRGKRYHGWPCQTVERVLPDRSIVLTLLVYFVPSCATDTRKYDDEWNVIIETNSNVELSNIMWLMKMRIVFKMQRHHEPFKKHVLSSFRNEAIQMLLASTTVSMSQFS